MKEFFRKNSASIMAICVMRRARFNFFNIFFHKKNDFWILETKIWWKKLHEFEPQYLIILFVGANALAPEASRSIIRQNLNNHKKIFIFWRQKNIKIFFFFRYITFWKKKNYSFCIFVCFYHPLIGLNVYAFLGKILVKF